MKGYQFALVRPDLRGDERDPAQRGGRACARAPEEVASSCASRSPRISSRSATRSRTSSRRSARRRVVRDGMENADGRSGSRVDCARRDGGARRARCRKPTAGSGLTELDVVLIARGDRPGRACPSRSSSTRWSAPRSSRTPRSPTGQPPRPAGDPFVPYAGSADSVLVEDDERLLLVANAPTLIAGAAAVGRPSRRLCTVDWDRTQASHAARWSTSSARRSTAVRSAAAAQLLGLAAWLLDTTVEYVASATSSGCRSAPSRRSSTSSPTCGSRSSSPRPLDYRAAYSVTHGDPAAPIHVSMAKARAGDVAALAARHALQCHGAIGYSFEHDLHLWMKRAWALVQPGATAPGTVSASPARSCNRYD